MNTDADYWRKNRVVYRRKAKKPRALLGKRRLITLAAIVGVLLVYVGFYQLFHLPRFQVETITVNGGDSDLRVEAEAELRKLIRGDAWHLYPRSNIFLVSPRGLEQQLIQDIPSINTIEVQKVLPQTLLVSVSPRIPWGIYCSGVPASCSYIDRGGVIYREAPAVEGSLITKIVSDGPREDIGQGVLSSETLLQFEELAREFQTTASIRITSFELKQNAPKDYWLHASEGFSVIVTREDMPARVAGIVSTVLQSEVKSNRASLEYIDARFGNKVFYKLR